MVATTLPVRHSQICPTCNGTGYLGTGDQYCDEHGNRFRVVFASTAEIEEEEEYDADEFRRVCRFNAPFAPCPRAMKYERPALNDRILAWAMRVFQGGQR